jgi:hypothetical protein
MINYKLLQDSIDYYEKYRYTRVEIPWTVSPYVDDITRPIEKTPFQLNVNQKRLVASGEQSFLYQYLKGFLPKGQFMGVTPCFRNESIDYLHMQYFMKNELIKTDIVNETELNTLISICLGFYQQYFKKELKVVKTDIGWDIMIDDYELGSYGIRESEFLKWIYATGCAEPRLSTLIEKYK